MKTHVAAIRGSPARASRNTAKVAHTNARTPIVDTGQAIVVTTT